MSKSSNFVSNTIILSIGTIAAKMIQYLLLPYYTDVLTTSEYGTIDNLQNVATLLIPIVSMTISEGIFRYAMDKNYDKRAVFSNGTIIDIIGTVVAIIIACIAALLINNVQIIEYIFVVVIYVSINIFRTNCSMYVKAIDKTLLYTIDNILLTFVTVVTNILFLSVAHWGVIGYMLGYIVGNLFSLCFLVIAAKLYTCLDFKLFSKGISKELLIFCVPLIPNTICWWISNCSDRFMITYFMGASENGIYAIAYKIPTVMTILIGIFLQAWQISANQASEDKKIGAYYTQMYKYLDAIVMTMGCVVIIFAKFLIDIMAADAYYIAWKYVPCLVLAICFFSKAQLLGTIYTTFRHTTMAFVTNLVAAVINIIGNFILIHYMGVMGAAIATAISYVALCYVRKIDTKKHVQIESSEIKEGIVSLLLLIEAVIYTNYPEYMWIAVLCMLLILAFQFKVLLQVAKKLFSVVVRKK